MSTRRKFLRHTALAAAGISITGNALFAGVRGDRKTGLALYTIRDDMMKDPVSALGSAAETGYNWVEAASYDNGKFYGFEPKEFGRIVRRTGMELLSTHNAIRPDNEDKMIADAAEAGLRYLILPSLPSEWSDSPSSYRKTAEYMNRLGEKCRKAGLIFGFHNHRIEFADMAGETPYDILLQNTDPELVIFEIDLAWITAAGKDPLDYFKKYPGRFEVWHMKDLTPDKQDATLGEGIIDFKAILAGSKTAGMKYWFLEQDNCRTHSAMESIAISRTYFLQTLAR